MAKNQTVKVDPKQLADAETLWAHFIQGSKLSIALIIVVVLSLAFFFVPTGA